jgi:hypothetical protein
MFKKFTTVVLELISKREIMRHNEYYGTQQQA